MSFLSKLFGAGEREKLENQVLTIFKAARYLATCGPFDEAKFDEVEKILSSHDDYNPNPEKLKSLKAQAATTSSAEAGLAGWNHVKVLEHQRLGEDSTTLLMQLKHRYPDQRTQAFIAKAIAESEDIQKLIATTNQTTQGSTTQSITQKVVEIDNLVTELGNYHKDAAITTVALQLSAYNRAFAYIVSRETYREREIRQLIEILGPVDEEEADLLRKTLPLLKSVIDTKRIRQEYLNRLMEALNMFVDLGRMLLKRAKLKDQGVPEEEIQNLAKSWKTDNIF